MMNASSFKRLCRQTLLAAGLMVLTVGQAVADGGSVRAMETSGGLKLSVFTAPLALAAGPVDVSVLVQDADSGDVLPQAAVLVTLTPRGRVYAAEQFAASREQATNRLFQACHPTLAAGWYDVAVRASHADRTGVVRFEMQVGPEPTAGSRFWPWFCWPAIPIALVAVHLLWARGTAGGGASILTTGGRSAAGPRASIR